MPNTVQKFIVRLPKETQDEIQSGLLIHGKVKIQGLGIFEIIRIGKRKGRNPVTGEIMMMPSYRKVKYRPTASLKQSVNI